MNSLRVGVLRGGPSSEYEVSLSTGKNVLKTISRDHYPVDILVSRNGEWHMKGVPLLPSRIFPHVDVIFNALHGEYGEDGMLGKLLESHQIPYTGSRVIPSALAMAKHRAKEIFLEHGIRTPNYLLIGPEEESYYDAPAKVLRMSGGPWIIKPASAGSSVGVSIAKTLHEIPYAIEKARFYDTLILIEEFIRGREASVGVIENFRGKEIYSLPAVEINPPAGSSFFDYSAKYGGASREICPGNFTKKEKTELEDLAVRIHKAMGLAHYSRSDFIVSKRGVYALEANTLPGLTDESLFPKSLNAVGVTLREFLNHIISLAYSRSVN